MSDMHEAAQGHGVWQIPGTRIDARTVSDRQLDAITKRLEIGLRQLATEGVVFVADPVAAEEMDIRDRVLAMVDHFDPVR